MAFDLNDLVKDALGLGVQNAAIADASKIRFHGDFRKACEKNVCGKFATSWMGPPAIGSITDLMDRARQFKQGLLVQSVYQLASPFDVKGMEKGGEIHEENFRRILAHLKKNYTFKDFLPLHAGCCHICEKCTYPDEPCRQPENAYASVEAYGIDVMRLEKDSGIPIYNGKNTCSFVSLYLFNTEEE